MAACIIQKKDLEKLGKILMKEFYEHVHDEYFLNEFDEVKLKRKFYDENLTEEFLSFHENEEKTLRNLYFDNLRYEDLVEMKTKDLLSKIETEIKDETLDFEIIYNFLDQMDTKLNINKFDDFEISEDLYCMKSAFMKMYKVYHYSYIYLDHDNYKISKNIDEGFMKNSFNIIKNTFSNMFSNMFKVFEVFN